MTRPLDLKVVDRAVAIPRADRTADGSGARLPHPMAARRFGRRGSKDQDSPDTTRWTSDANH